MNEKPRMTRQGLRDLNHYGPKKPTAATVASKSAEEATITPAAPVPPPAAGPTPADK